MSTTSIKQKTQKENEQKIISGQIKPLFNSKLFLDVDINESLDEYNENSDNNTEVSDNSFELEEINYLSNELIEKLDFCDNDLNISKERDNKNNNSEEKNNIVDSLLSLANNGYEFKPKNYKPTYNNSQTLFNKNINNNSYINPMLNNNNNNYIFLYKNINNNVNNNVSHFYRDQKKDWICSFCNNLNFSFRTKCNRCKISKEDSDKRKNNFMNLVL